MDFTLINQPPHFFTALFTIISFLLATFSKNESVKKWSHRALYVAYAVMFITGGYLFLTLHFTFWVLMKSVGGIALMIMAEMIVRGNRSVLLWSLLLITAAAGLGIAYFLI